jgi:hypothetical protein
MAVLISCSCCWEYSFLLVMTPVFIGGLPVHCCVLQATRLVRSMLRCTVSR